MKFALRGSADWLKMNSGDTTVPSRIETLRPTLLAGGRLVGLFTRLADPDVVDTLAAARLDFAVLDVEHGSLDRQDVGRIMASARTRDLPTIVRVAGDTPCFIQHAMTAGASGVIVPHIVSPDQAARVVAFVRGSAMERAYAGMGRPSDLRRREWKTVEAELLRQFVLILQIDEIEGLAHAAAIAQTAGADAIFMGSLSLALALEKHPQSRSVDAAMQEICRVCAAADRRVGMHQKGGVQATAWAGRGVNFFVAGNDYSLLFECAQRAHAAFD